MITEKMLRDIPEPPKTIPGYHIKDIKKGTVGESSKIREEVEELIDAEEQHNKIMMLCELSDIYGAMDAFLQKHFPDLTMQDVEVMAHTTARAFKSGHRKS
jgi:phosphoribosyl-ATP pyrophosphohydrolase